MTDWQPIETAPTGTEIIIATWGTKSTVCGIDVVRRIKNGWEGPPSRWESTLSSTVYTANTSHCYTLLKWMPAPALHPSEMDLERAQLKADLDAWVEFMDSVEWAEPDPQSGVVSSSSS